MWRLSDIDICEKVRDRVKSKRNPLSKDENYGKCGVEFSKNKGLDFVESLYVLKGSLKGFKELLGLVSDRECFVS